MTNKCERDTHYKKHSIEWKRQKKSVSIKLSLASLPLHFSAKMMEHFSSFVWQMNVFAFNVAIYLISFSIFLHLLMKWRRKCLRIRNSINRSKIEVKDSIQSNNNRRHSTRFQCQMQKPSGNSLACPWHMSTHVVWGRIQHIIMTETA